MGVSLFTIMVDRLIAWWLEADALIFHPLNYAKVEISEVHSENVGEYICFWSIETARVYFYITEIWEIMIFETIIVGEYSSCLRKEKQSQSELRNV